LKNLFYIHKLLKPEFLVRFGYIIILVVLVFGALTLIQPILAEKENATGDISSDPIPVYPVKLPAALDFAGEKVPLQNFDIKESLDREMIVNVYYQSQTLLSIKRANRYFPVIEPILKANGIPDDFKYLAVIESALTHPTSPAGAKGIWQFIEGTAKEYKLEVNKEVDERYNVERSTRAACDFLKESYEIYHNWTLAAASFNIGRKRLSQELDRQKVNSYYDLTLNEETGRYLFRVLSIKSIMQNPTQYGYHISKDDLYPSVSFTEVIVDTPVTHFADFARKFSINYKVLKLFNPWLRENYLSNKEKKSYIILIPKDCRREYNYYIDNISAPADSSSNE